MLYEFSLEGRKKNARELNITYFVSGLGTLSDGYQCHRCKVVTEDQLEDEKAQFTTVTSCHVYSIQAAKLKDTDSLYITDYDKLREDVFSYNKYGSIEHENVEVRTAEQVRPKIKPAESNIPTTSKTESSKDGGSKGKAPQKGGIAGMFGNAAPKQGKAAEKKEAPAAPQYLV